MRFKKEEGFTLVELMVVVLIIGILVAVAIPVFNSASDSARRRACQANLRTLDGAVEQYKAADEANAALVTAWGTTVASAAGPLGSYVKDWAGSIECPGAGGAYTLAAGDFSCTITTVGSSHNYEDN